MVKVLFRASLAEENELSIAKKYLDVVESRMDARNGLVVGRYSVLPYYQELNADLAKQNCRLVNSYKEHKYLANVSEWYTDLKGLTPETWEDFISIPKEISGPFVLKGQTNSRKQLWKTHMFAKDREAAGQVLNKLLDDTMLSHQGIVIRKFEELVSCGEDLTGIPISKEFRFFVLDDQVICGGFYWSQHVDEIKEKWSVDEVPQDLLQSVIKRVGTKARFYTIDVAQKASDGSWIVVELGDAQMAGLSCNDPHALYSGIRRILSE